MLPGVAGVMKHQRDNGLAKVGVHPNFAAIKKQREDSINKVGTHPNFAEILRRRQAGQMSEEEMNELLGLFKKKNDAKPSPFAKPKNAIGHGDKAYRTNHHYGNGDIEPSTVPIFKPTWQNR